jgi:phosphate transport system protein
MREDIILMSRISTNMFEQCMRLFFDERAVSIQNLEEMKKQQEVIEKEIERTAAKLITLQQPVAKDTREIICAVLIAADWMKISSHITDISDISVLCTEKIELDSEEWKMLRLIKDAAEKMLNGAAEAYRTRNTDKALFTAETDDEIDRTLWKMWNNFPESGGGSSFSFYPLMIAEHIERIGDHAANICEEIMYLEKYEQVRLNN